MIPSFMKIRPSILFPLAPSLMISIFTFIIASLSLLVFESSSDLLKNLSFIIIFSLSLGLLFIIIFLPSLLFEKINVTTHELTHITLLTFKAKSIQINDIEKIQEEWRRNRGTGGGSTRELVLKGKHIPEDIRIFYKKYHQDDIENLINFLIQINPNIINTFMKSN
jgi:hypothetical protein